MASDNPNNNEFKPNTSNLIRERAKINRDLRITSLLQKPFKEKDSKIRYANLFDKTQFYKTPEQFKREEERKLQKFRNDLEIQLREKDRIKLEEKLEEQRQEKRLEKRYQRQIQELQLNFDLEHDFEKPSVSRLRNPEAHKLYEERLKLFNKRERERDLHQKRIVKQESLFTDMMDNVMKNSLKTRDDIESENFRNDDILDRLIKNEREKESDVIKDGLGFVVDHNLENDFKRATALLGDLDDIAKFSTFKKNYENLKELEKYQNERKKFDCSDLTLSLDLDNEVFFPPKDFGKLHTIEKDREKRLIFEPLKFKKHLQGISMRSSWAQSESLMGY